MITPLCCPTKKLQNLKVNVVSPHWVRMDTCSTRAQNVLGHHADSRIEPDKNLRPSFFRGQGRSIKSAELSNDPDHEKMKALDSYRAQYGFRGGARERSARV